MFQKISGKICRGLLEFSERAIRGSARYGTSELIPNVNEASWRGNTHAKTTPRPHALGCNASQKQHWRYDQCGFAGKSVCQSVLSGVLGELIRKDVSALGA